MWSNNNESRRRRRTPSAPDLCIPGKNSRSGSISDTTLRWLFYPGRFSVALLWSNTRKNELRWRFLVRQRQFTNYLVLTQHKDSCTAGRNPPAGGTGGSALRWLSYETGSHPSVLFLNSLLLVPMDEIYMGKDENKNERTEFYLIENEPVLHSLLLQFGDESDRFLALFIDGFRCLMLSGSVKAKEFKFELESRSEFEVAHCLGRLMVLRISFVSGKINWWKIKVIWWGPIKFKINIWWCKCNCYAVDPGAPCKVHPGP